MYTGCNITSLQFLTRRKLLFTCFGILKSFTGKSQDHCFKQSEICIIHQNFIQLSKNVTAQDPPISDNLWIQHVRVQPVALKKKTNIIITG